jgi:hypothetical protein
MRMLPTRCWVRRSRRALPGHAATSSSPASSAAKNAEAASGSRWPAAAPRTSRRPALSLEWWAGPARSWLQVEVGDDGVVVRGVHPVLGLASQKGPLDGHGPSWSPWPGQDVVDALVDQMCRGPRGQRIAGA